MSEGKSLQFADKSERDVTAMFILVATIVVAALFYWPARNSPSIAIRLAYTIAATSSIAMVIWQACEPFAQAAQWIGIRFKIPSSVRGATLDAVASSMPELFSGIFFVTVAITATENAQQQLAASTEGFGSSIAICAGSSIYNLILIPAVCAIAIAAVRPEKPQIEFSQEVVSRDGSWVIATQFGLLVVLFMPRLYWWIGLIGMVGYCIYIVQMYFDARRFRKDTKAVDRSALPPSTLFGFGFFKVRLSLPTVIITLTTATLVAAAACYFLVELTNESAHAMGVPPFFVAVILAAAASSIPDTFVSLGSARRGDDSGAISNVFGSNIFDICIGMSIPLLVCCFLNDWQPLILISDNRETIQGVAGLRILLFVLTAIVMYQLWTKRMINRRMGYFFCLLYMVFVGYAVLGSINVL